MEFTIKSISSRLLLERSDNGIILYDLGDDNVVISKIVYEIYYKDGVIDFDNMTDFIKDLMENLKIPIIESETNRALQVCIEKIDPDKPSLLDEEGSDEDDE
jgi:adenine C2-methylase RlmN of 23S rRNA A2503 and tRNA A37